MQKTNNSRGKETACAVVLLLLISCFACPSNADSVWDWNSRVMSAQVDITGDGKSENIRLERFENKRQSQYFRLSVNGQIIYDFSPGVGKVVGFVLADIDKADRYKEIVVMADGYQSSDWVGSSIYYYDGKKIHRVTKEPLMQLKFLGDGRVLFYDVISYLVAEIPYYLQANHTLKRAPQKYFKSEINAVVNDPFPIYSKSNIHKIAMLRKGTKVRILKSDLGDWLYLRAGRRTYGWMNTRWNSPYKAFDWVAAG